VIPLTHPIVERLLAIMDGLARWQRYRDAVAERGWWSSPRASAGQDVQLAAR